MTEILTIRSDGADLRLSIADLQEISAALANGERYSPLQRHVDATLHVAVRGGLQ